MIKRRWVKKGAGPLLAFAIALTGLAALWTPRVFAEEVLNVSEALAQSNSGQLVTVEGYIVGHASGSLSADFTAPFANDYNVLIADDPGERNTGRLMDVQLTSAFRSEFGLATSPGLVGTKIRATGSLLAYNSFSGIKNPTAIAKTSGSDGDAPLEGGAGKKVLFDNTHGQTAGAADWVIDGGFSDFAAALAAEQFEVDQLDRSIPYTFGEQAITYDKLKDYDVFIVGEANIPFKQSEQVAMLQYVNDGGSLFFIADHYNADRNKNRWDSSEVMNGYRRGAYTNPALGMTAEEAASLAMSGVAGSDWLADHFGLRYRYNAVGNINATDVVAPSQAFGITSGVNSVAVHAGSTIAILDRNRAKGIVYLPASGVSAWSSAVDQGVYNGGGRAEGAFAAVSKLGKGKAAFIGDSSPVEDATPKYLREETGSSKTTYDGFKEADDSVFLVNTVKWLGMQEDYTGFDQIAGLTLDTPTVLLGMEQPAASTEPEPEPWSAPTAGYKWYAPSTFKPGSYGSVQSQGSAAGYSFTLPDKLSAGGTFSILLRADGLASGETVADLKAGLYLSGGEQIARFRNADGTWTPYGYSPSFSMTAGSDGRAVRELTVQLKADASGGASLRLKQGSANVLTRTITVSPAGSAVFDLKPTQHEVPEYHAASGTAA